MTDKKITATDATALPQHPDIDRAALILFDGKSRERFDFTRTQAEDGNPIAYGPIIGPIIDRTMSAIWPHTDMTKAGGTQTAQPAPRGVLMPNGKVLLEEGTVRVTDATGSFDHTYEPGDVMPADQWLLKVGPLPLSLADQMKPEPVGELLNPNVVKLIEGEVYDLMHHLTYKPGDQMSAEVWKRVVGPLPTATADDAPVGYQLGDSAPVGSTIHITAYDGLRILGDVAITPDGEIYDRIAWLESPDDHRKAVYAVLRELHGVTTRSPSEAHAIAGATHLDEALSGSTEGISQSILAAAAEAADLEPVSEAGGDDRSVADIRKDMATAFDVLTDYWDSEGMPEGVEMKLRELLAEDTPDPALMSDVLFVIDADGGNARAIITEDGIRLEGGSARSHGLLGEATGILPLILERETNRKLYAATTLADASKAIRYAIESGEDVDAAGNLIEDLWRWLNGNPENPNIWVNEGQVDDIEDCPPLTGETRDRIKAAIDTDIADIAREVRDEDLAARAVTMEEMHQAAAEICGKDFDHAAGDAYLAERQDQSALDRIRGEAACATAGIVDRMRDVPVWRKDPMGQRGAQAAHVGIDKGASAGDTSAFTISGQNGEELAKAYHRAATMGTAWLHLTSAHAEGVTVKLVTPQDIDPDFADAPITREPQDSDAPDGVAADEAVDPRDSAFISAKHYAGRYGVGILVRGPGGRYSACSPHKVKVKRNKGVTGPAFIAVSRDLT